MNEFEKMISGRLYNAFDSKLGVYHMERMACVSALKPDFDNGSGGD